MSVYVLVISFISYILTGRVNTDKITTSSEIKRMYRGTKIWHRKKRNTLLLGEICFPQEKKWEKNKIFTIYIISVKLCLALWNKCFRNQFSFVLEVSLKIRNLHIQHLQIDFELKPECLFPFKLKTKHVWSLNCINL